MDEKLVAVLFLLPVFIVFVAVGPICSIWALNTLFGMEIVLTFKTWCAMAWIHLFFAGSIKSSKKD